MNILLNILLDFAEELSLYMIVDASADERIYKKIKNSNRSYSCLFDGEKTPEAIKCVAPFLLKIKQHDDFTHWCFNNGLDRHWMILFTAHITPLPQLRRQFKRLAFANIMGKLLYFRYYDPRVMPGYLKSCCDEKRKYFYKDIRSFIIPSVSAVDKKICFTQFHQDGSENVLTTPFSYAEQLALPKALICHPSI